MSKTVAYIRVSSKDQNLDRQLEELKRNKFYDFVRLYENGGIKKWEN